MFIQANDMAKGLDASLRGVAWRVVVGLVFGDRGTPN